MIAITRDFLFIFLKKKYKKKCSYDGFQFSPTYSNRCGQNLKINVASLLYLVFMFSIMGDLRELQVISFFINKQYFFKVNLKRYIHKII